jgi:hypothetical protein
MTPGTAISCYRRARPDHGQKRDLDGQLRERSTPSLLNFVIAGTPGRRPVPQ